MRLKSGGLDLLIENKDLFNRMNVANNMFADSLNKAIEQDRDDLIDEFSQLSSSRDKMVKEANTREELVVVVEIFENKIQKIKNKL